MIKMLENGSTFTICSHIKTIGHYAFFTNDVYVITKLNITCDLLVPLARKLPLSTNHQQFGTLLVRRKTRVSGSGIV
jgi:hypothetical protein